VAKLENAHSAEADTNATYEIFNSQTVIRSGQTLSEFLSTKKSIAGFIALNLKVKKFYFRKNKGRLVIRKEPGYYMDSRCGFSVIY
jgi:DNA polymerase-3 subunit epsilon